eukprot:gene9941-7116_t
MNTQDLTSLGAGVAIWASVIPVVKYAGQVCVDKGNTGKNLFLLIGVGIAAVTTPAMSYLMGWKTREAKIRGIALALGTAQTLDGVVHMLYPHFYSTIPSVALAAAGNIFWGAGLLGIFSVYT